METELKPLDHLDKQIDNVEHAEHPLLKPDSQSSDQSTTPIPEKQHTQSELAEMEKKFAAYVRHDVYGPMGLGEVSVTEKILLGVAMVTLLPLRVVVAMTVLVIYYLICKICTLFSAKCRSDEGEQQPQQVEDYAHLRGWRREIIVRCGRFLSRVMLFIFGFYWISNTSRVYDYNELDDENDSRDQLEKSERPGVVISNHVSYLDILYHMSSSFPSFVAKRSVSKLPLVGLISKCLGCVYVQREDKSSDFKGVSGVVTERIKEAHENSDAPLMLIFPEGTTTNGNFLLPFKTGAFIARAPVLPVLLRYPYQRFSPAWDSISGVRHVILLLCQFVNYMEVMRLPIYYPSKEEKDDPKLYANNVRKIMADEGNLILSDIGLPEKRIYHAALNGNYSLRSVCHQKTD